MTVGERIEKFKKELSFHFREKAPLEIEHIVGRLQLEGFFTAPASTKYHGNYEGGLFDHSCAVAKALVRLDVRNNLTWFLPRSPWLVGMFHDICKIDRYKREVIGWAGDTPIYGDCYEYTDDTLYKGHGDKSVILLASYFDLSPEEVACIRYHMGAFTDREEWKHYTRAIHDFPNVLWTHHADMIVSHIEGV